MMQKGENPGKHILRSATAIAVMNLVQPVRQTKMKSCCTGCVTIAC